jgi:hypothetical protein
VEISVPELTCPFDCPLRKPHHCTALAYDKMAVQFTLSRMFQLVAIVAILCSLFASLPWPVALVALAVINLIACIAFFRARRWRTGALAGATAISILTFLLFTAWGLSQPADRASWPDLILICVLELAVILDWFLFFHR